MLQNPSIPFYLPYTENIETQLLAVSTEVYKNFNIVVVKIFKEYQKQCKYLIKAVGGIVIYSL